MAFDPEAVYNETVANINLQAGQEEGALAESETNLKANTGYQESQITRAEPGVYRAGTNAANRGGLLTSGINSHRKEGIASNFAARRTQNQLGLTEGEGRIKREREGGKLKRERETHGAEERRTGEKDQYAKEHPPAPYSPPGTPPIPVAAQAPEGMEYKNGLTVPIGTKTVGPVTPRSAPKGVKGKYVPGPNGTRIYQAWN